MPLDRDDHAGLGGPFTLIDNAEGRRIAYTEVQGDSRLYTGPGGSRARSPLWDDPVPGAHSARVLAFIEKLLGDMMTLQDCDPETAWFKSSYSSGEGGESIESLAQEQLQRWLKAASAWRWLPQPPRCTSGTRSRPAAPC